MNVFIENQVLKCAGETVGCTLQLNTYDLQLSVKGMVVYQNKLALAVDTLEGVDAGEITGYAVEKTSHSAQIVFQTAGGIWEKKELVLDVAEHHISLYACLVGSTDGITDVTYFAPNGKTGFSQLVAPRFDWTYGEVVKSATEDDILSCQQWLSPPPYCYVLKEHDQYVPMGISAKQGQNNYVSMKHLGNSHCFSLQFEGHQSVDGTYETPKLTIFQDGASLKEALTIYKAFLVAEGCVNLVENKEIPAWWREPIFCGWGEMRYDYRQDHDDHENGNFVNVTDYCTQLRYEGYLEALEKQDINPGTVIIDMGWALNPALGEPNPHKWQDVRQFIDNQHEKGRHVLLWYTPFVVQGLPDEMCLMLDGRPVCPDPTNPAYQELLTKEVYKMLSSDPGCLNGDGFKIDFTQNAPSEEGVFTSYIPNFFGLINETTEKHLYPKRQDRDRLISVYEKNVWGMELLKQAMKNIYTAMKIAKKDSLFITHTVNPYFAEVVDMLRLNDLDGESEGVLEIMKNRAMLAKIGCDQWLIDTDNDLMVDKAHWRDYLKLQLELGIPDTYYATHIATSYEAFDETDYDVLRQVFQTYRQTLG